MRFEIVCNEDGEASPQLRACHRCTHLVTEDVSGASRGNPAIKPSVAPIDQPKAVHFAVVAWGLDQTLPTPPLETPDACERRMKGELHLTLQVEVGVWQSPEELWHIGRKLTPQISLDQVLDG